VKLSPRAFRILWDVHAWVGVVASLVLFPVFFFGTFALFVEELVPWQEPRLRAPVPVSEARLLALAQAEVEAALPHRPELLGVTLPGEGEPWLQVLHVQGGVSRTTWLHPATGERLSGGSDLGEFLNGVHFLAPLPWGLELAGLASVVLLLLVGTGVLLQLGRLVRELVQFRPRERRQLLWLDAHKVVGVSGAPFLLVFALSGALLGLGGLLRPALVEAAYGGDAEAAAGADGWRPAPPPRGEPGGAPDLAASLARARAHFPDAQHRWFFVSHLGDAGAVVDLPGVRPAGLAPFTNVRLSLAQEVLWLRERGGESVVARAVEVVHGLHFAGWAGGGTKAVYALLSLLAAFGLLAGNLAWLERRRAQAPAQASAQAPAPGRLDVLLARLMAGHCGGLALALGVVLLANQLLPAGMEGRAQAEHRAFAAAWLLALGAGLWARDAARTAQWLLAVAGGLLLAVPLVDAVRASRVPLLPEASHRFATELGLLALGALLLGAALAVRRLRAGAPALPAPDAAPSPC
jgi:uncharacterized iron-regulated membrane protein